MDGQWAHEGICLKLVNVCDYVMCMNELILC
jgi:hypothetical protein